MSLFVPVTSLFFFKKQTFWNDYSDFVSSISWSGTKAADDSEISESHAESGKSWSHKPASDFSYDRTEGDPGFTFYTIHTQYIFVLSQSLQAPRKHSEAENGTVDAVSKSKDCNGTALLSECALQEVRDDLQLHLCLSSLFMFPAFLSSPSLIYWIRNLRCWRLIAGKSWKQTYHNYSFSLKKTL